MLRNLPFLILMVVSLVSLNAQTEIFEFKHEAGDRYRILSVVNQDVYINRVLSHRAEILNRIAVEVTDVVDGRGLHNAIFQTSERIIYSASRMEQTGAAGFEWSNEYESVFERDRLGYITIDPKYYMPVVRNVPVFPDRPVRMLERWSAEGHETHDFRTAFGIVEPYVIPFNANYQYIGEFEWNGVRYPCFSINYRIDSRPSEVRGRIWPRRIMGLFNQRVYWDREKGQPIAYEETFRLTFEMSDGRTIEYRGTAEAEVLDSEDMDTEHLAREITEEIDRLEIPDVNVRAVEGGVSISLEDIGFYPDSDVMLPGEIEKLSKIADILKRYPERDILIGGHTALAGTPEGRMRLSIERARAVQEYFLSQDVRTADRMVVRGYGAERPIADNRTEEGMRRNRRVEITILEN